MTKEISKIRSESAAHYLCGEEGGGRKDDTGDEYPKPERRNIKTAPTDLKDALPSLLRGL